MGLEDRDCGNMRKRKGLIKKAPQLAIRYVINSCLRTFYGGYLPIWHIKSAAQAFE